MSHIPDDFSPQSMINCLAEAGKYSEGRFWSDLIDKAIEIYYGLEHDAAHRLLLENVNNLEYNTILVLLGQLKTPLTKNSLELQVHLLAFIMKATNWDGTGKMLTTVYEGNPINDPYLSGHIIENFCYANPTSEEIISELRQFFYSSDVFIVKAALVSMYGWQVTSAFKNTELLDEIKILATETDDASIKLQVNEIIAASLRGNAICGCRNNEK